VSWLETKPADAVADAVVDLMASTDPATRDLVDNYCGGDGRFALWMSLLNKRCITMLGLQVMDLEDWHWRDAYDAGDAPREAFLNFLEEYPYYRDEDV
jgi:hypothetical protein